MLLELAIADAYGAAFEVAPEAFVAAENDGQGYRRNPRFDPHGVAPLGRYTDDTQMSLAIAEHLLSGAPWTRAAMAGCVVAAFRRDPRAGYAAGFQQFLETCTSGADFVARIRPYSEKNGAAMRAAPVGILPNVAAVRAYAARQASLTHDTPAGRLSAEAVALACHHGLHALGPLSALPAFLRRTLGDAWPSAWAEPWTGRVPVLALPTVQAVLTALAGASSLTTVLRRAVAFGGDTDTVAAIAVAIASTHGEVRSDLAPALYAELEAGRYGITYLRQLDAALRARVRVTTPPTRVAKARPVGPGTLPRRGSPRTAWWRRLWRRLAARASVHDPR